MLAFDGSNGAMKGVGCAGYLVGQSDHHFQLYCMIKERNKFWKEDHSAFVHDNVSIPIDTRQNKMGPYLHEACRRLLDADIPPDHISIKIYASNKNRGYQIVQEAEESGFDSVVVGRRELVTFIDEYVVGRLTDQVLKLADQQAL